MYKPPENSNRVRAMKSKFENNENINTQLYNNVSKPPAAALSRQLSDPVKVNIKRSPAFRNDKVLQRNGTQISVKLNKNKSLTSKYCDNNRKNPVTETKSLEPPTFSTLRKRFDSQENLFTKSKQMLKERSNTCEEIVRNKSEDKEELRYENISVLYTKPIPKCQRQQKEITIHTTSTLKLSEVKKISTNSTHQEYVQKLNVLTDTLKLALKKPLPQGPAPKKPPRTFQHSPKTNKTKEEFAQKLNDNLQKNLEQKKSPAYMLEKLENALKANRGRLQRHKKVDVSSGEEEALDGNKMGKLNFNCLQSLSCSNATYEAISQPTSKFFDDEEPVYAEPFVFPSKDAYVKDDDKKMNRNSLYYMSSPVTSPNGLYVLNTMDDDQVLNSGETSSISSPTTSDIESLTSTPSEENKVFGPHKVVELIRSFEKKKSDVNPECRVDNLEKQLKKTLEKSFQSSSDGNSSGKSSLDEENKDMMVGKFETYVRTVRMISKLKKNSDGQHLFHCCMLVGHNGKEPYVKFQFPKDVNLPYKIEYLCFPDSGDSTIDCSLKAQNYSILLTGDDGERIYGYCRRVLPENSTTCLPLAYCILSKNKAPRFYRKILQELESRHGIPDKIRDILLNEIYYHKFPVPGESVRINLAEVNKHISNTTLTDDSKLDDDNTNATSIWHDNEISDYEVIECNGSLNPVTTNGASYNRRNGILFQNGFIPKEIIDDYNGAQRGSLILTMDHDGRYKENDLEELCNTLSVNILLKVFATLLLERKVVFISCVLGKLSTCIEAIQNMLYPFSWPHTLIPVLPKDLWEIVEAPTPFICGALSLTLVNNYTIEDGIVVDLDEGAILMEVGDENKILPSCMVNELKEGMALAKSSNGKNENVLVSDAFLRIFIRSCGHYKDFLKDGHFQKDTFSNHPKRKAVKRFLKWFTETTMFYNFVETIQKDPDIFQIFDKRIQIYRSQDAKLILEKMKDWKKEPSLSIF